MSREIEVRSEGLENGPEQVIRVCVCFSENNVNILKWFLKGGLERMFWYEVMFYILREDWFT